jgi:hypothetical protein
MHQPFPIRSRFDAEPFRTGASPVGEPSTSLRTICWFFCRPRASGDPGASVLHQFVIKIAPLRIMTLNQPIDSPLFMPGTGPGSPLWRGRRSYYCNAINMYQVAGGATRFSCRRSHEVLEGNHPDKSCHCEEPPATKHSRPEVAPSPGDCFASLAMTAYGFIPCGSATPVGD